MAPSGDDSSSKSHSSEGTCVHRPHPSSDRPVFGTTESVLKWVQPVWLQPSRDRKPLRYREEVLVRRIGPGSEVRPRGHYSQSRLKGEAQGTYPDRCSTSPKRERSGVGPHERRSE